MSAKQPQVAAGPTYRIASVGLTRDVNRAAIFRMIGASGPIARATIARRLQLSPATVTSVTRQLLDQGLVRVADRAKSARGRPALLLELVGSAAAAFGAKVAADHVVGVRVDLEAEVVEHFEAPFDATAPDALDRLATLVSGWISASESDAPLLGVGLGVSGVVDVARGTVDSPLLGWQDVALVGHLQDRLGLPVFVDNDVNTLAVSERLYGRGRDSENFATVTIGRGIGLGIIAGGDIYRGAGGGAGELGHTAVVEGGPLCTCGRHGCLEAVAADPALVREAREASLLGPREGIERLRELADQGDPKAQLIFSEAGRALGRAVANLAAILNPDLVLISGEGTQAWTHMVSRFDEAFRSGLFAPLGDVRVEVDPWDDTKWAVGAATLVLRASFAAPFDHASRAAEASAGVVA